MPGAAKAGDILELSRFPGPKKTSPWIDDRSEQLEGDWDRFLVKVIGPRF